MTQWSVIFGIIGVLGTGAITPLLRRRVSDWGTQRCWFVGLAALSPAWLVAFVGLLPTVTGNADRVPLPPVAILSSSAALFGIIVTHYALRRLHRSGHTFCPVVYWLFGLVAFLPAWCIALVNLP